MESLTGYCRPSVSISPASSNCSSSFSDTSTSRHEFKDEAAFDSNNQPISDEELAKLSVRQLNMRLQGHDRETVSVIKQKRRTLKNRGYALNCRLRRIQNQNQVEADCVRLREQVRYLTQMVNELNKRLYEATNAQYYETAPALIQTAQPPSPIEMRVLPHTIAQMETYPPIQDEHAIMSNLAPVSRVSSNATAECFYTTI